MPESYPRLREDLIIGESAQPDETFFILKDPITKKFFRLRRPEYFIARQLDGRTAPEEIQRRFEREFGTPLPGPKLEKFILHLEERALTDAGLTEREIARQQRRSASGRGSVHRLLYAKVKALDPDRSFGALLPHIGFFFTRGFVVLAVALILVAVGVTVSSWEEYTEQAKGLFRPDAVPMLLLALFIVTGLHESAHGLTCKRFGGRVHEIGILFIYFLPAFYCDVSDAWFFKEKGRRLWVSFAGVFFQVFVWALATLLWQIIDPEIWLSDFCALVMATSGVTALFNLNPLIKLDGYYLLSDYTGIPNLRKRAFDYVFSQVQSRLFSRGERARQVTVRERRIYTAYGITASLYTLALLVFIVLKIAVFVVARFEGGGLIALAVIAFFLFTGSLEGWMIRIRRWFWEGRSVNTRRRNIVGLAATVAAAVAILTFGKWELKVSSRSELFPISMASVRAEVAGTIRLIHVDEGRTVEAGDPLTRLDDTEIQAQLKETEAQIRKWQAELELLEKGPRQEEILRAEKAVEKAGARVSFAEKECDRARELHAQNLISAAEYERAQEELKVLRKEREQAETDVMVLRAGNRPERIRAAQAEIAQLEASREFLRQQAARTVIVSPIDGIVSTHRLSERVKEHLEVGDEICRVVDCRTMRLEIPVSEKDVGDVRVGQRVKFKARSFPRRAFYGKVASVAPVAVDRSSRKVVLVTSEVDNPDLLLRPGMTGNAKIYCGKRRIIDLWTRKIIRWIRVQFWW